MNSGLPIPQFVPKLVPPAVPSVALPVAPPVALTVAPPVAPSVAPPVLPLAVAPRPVASLRATPLSVAPVPLSGRPPPIVPPVVSAAAKTKIKKAEVETAATVIQWKKRLRRDRMFDGFCRDKNV